MDPQTAAPRDENALDLDTAIFNAAQTSRSIVLLIGEFGPAGADRSFRNALDDPVLRDYGAGIDLLTLDLSISRNRATAARYHVVQTPVLVCLSPNGLIVSRDVGPVTPAIVIQRMDGLGRRAADLDARLFTLESKNSLASQPALAEFLLTQQNDREAISVLSFLANSHDVEAGVRVRAWVELARAHLWIGEPEKARHEAKNLIVTLGPATPDAISGGNLVLGTQDAAAKRFALARQEFQAAIAAAPASDYAKEGAKDLAQLPPENK